VNHAAGTHKPADPIEPVLAWFIEFVSSNRGLATRFTEIGEY